MLPGTRLVFACCVGPQRFRVDGEHVVGVALRTEARSVPHASMWTHGVRRHGAWVPLMDLRPTFGLTDTVASMVDHFLFVEVEGVVVGLVVDRVIDASADASTSADASPLDLASLVDVRSARRSIEALQRSDAS